jgi:hypothetical protein
MVDEWIPVKGNLVHWVNGPPKNIGLVSEVSDRTVTVHFDSGETLPFAWPSDVIQRYLFKPGDRVQLRPKNELGVVLSIVKPNPLAIYEIGLRNGNPKVDETGLRPPIITYPVELLHQGEIHNARSTNLRITGTRLLFDYQFNEFSSLSNSRVEIKPHQ